MIDTDSPFAVNSARLSKILREEIEPDTDSPFADVGCALPDLRVFALTALGLSVIGAALAVWAVRRLRTW